MVISAGVLAVIATGMDVLVRNAVIEHLLHENQLPVGRVSAAVRHDSLPEPIPESPTGVRIQVFDAQRRVISATRSAAGRPAMSRYWPPPDDRVRDFVECPAPGGGCLVVEAIRTSPAPDAPVVYGGRPLPSMMANGGLEALLGLAVAALTALTALATWRIVGRTLRPVEQIRGQLADISGSDLSRRVPQPDGADEIAQLARTANETLERLERSIQRQRQFASDASHELRTPIAGLLATLEDAAMHPDDTDMLNSVRAALHDAERLQSITADLLLLARIGTGAAAYEQIDLGQLVTDEVQQRTFDIAVRTKLMPGLVVCGVRMQLIRLFTNVLHNAERHAETTIDIECYQRHRNVYLAVTDDGAGIPPQDRERVFERFTRLDSARSRSCGGTGLGLTIARDIAQAHQGSLRIEDSSRGARLVLRLSLAGPSIVAAIPGDVRRSR
jgi:signal transduction histidine kinase